MTEPIDVHSLMERIAQGDRTALAELYRVTAPRLYGIALRLLGEEAAAAGVLKALFLELWTEGLAFAGATPPVDRMAARVRAIALDAAHEAPPRAQAPQPFTADLADADPLAAPQRSPALQRLLACLGQLPEDRRRMCLLAYYDGWSREALSAAFDAPPHAVNTWLWRCVAELDACLPP